MIWYYTYIQYMKSIDLISHRIDRIQKNYVFTHDDFIEVVNNKETIIKSLNRLAEKGIIQKLSKGKFYKPDVTELGLTIPSPYQVVKDLLEVNGKPVGYLTGLSYYSQLGLSTQIGNIIEIGKNDVRADFTRGHYKIHTIRQKNKITKDNVPLLQLLDAIRFINKIPDTTIAKSVKQLSLLIRYLTKQSYSSLIKLSLAYPPSTRAILGAILDELELNEHTNTLLSSLNPITSYKLMGANKLFKKAHKWHLKDA